MTTSSKESAAVLNSQRLPTIKWKEMRTLSTPKGGYVSGLFRENLILAGGTTWKDGKKLVLNSVVAYDLARDCWKTLPPLPKPLAYGFGGATEKGFYYFAGADPSGPSLEGYFLGFQDHEYRWDYLTRVPQPFCYASAVILENSLYVLGGTLGPDDFTTVSDAVWTLNFLEITGGWKLTSTMPRSGRALCAVTVCQGRIFIFGGCKAGSSGGMILNLRDANSYDPEAAQWQRLKPIPVATRAWSACSWNDRHIFLFGGVSSHSDASRPVIGKFEQRIYRYDTWRDEYEEVGQLPRAVCDTAFHRIENQIIGAGGEPAPKTRAPWTMLGQIE